MYVPVVRQTPSGPCGCGSYIVLRGLISFVNFRNLHIQQPGITQVSKCRSGQTVSQYRYPGMYEPTRLCGRSPQRCKFRNLVLMSGVLLERCKNHLISYRYAYSTGYRLQGYRYILYKPVRSYYIYNLYIYYRIYIMVQLLISTDMQQFLTNH